MMTGMSFCMTMGIPVLLHEVFGVYEENAALIALITAFCINFFTARTFVFQSREAMLPQLLRFFLTSLMFRGGEYLTFLAVHRYLEMYYLLALFSVLLVSFVLKFLFYKVFVFKSFPERPATAK